MDWNFSFGWFILGLLILVAGTLVVVFYQPISHKIASGVASYQKVKLYGLITAGVGFLIMANIHTLLLTALVNLIFKR